MNQVPIPIAVIGVGLRLPGDVINTPTLWNLVAEGKNCWSRAPSQRYNESAFYHPNPENNGTTNHRGGHFLRQDIAAFDATFFGISPLEAQAMDPQQRILLEISYEAFEDAGIRLEDIYGSDTAVYVAMFTRDYDRNIYKDTSTIPKYHVTGTGDAIASNRLSYVYNLRGPSMTLDTGCSGSIVALHQACQSLRSGESGMALASGVSLIINPDHMIGMSNLHMLNNEGRSFPFDNRGSGYGRGEGAAVVLLKRLDDALQAGDNVRAIIRNTAVNQDGKTNGITLPNQQAQEELLRSVYKAAFLDPRNIYYVEAHGTGTSAGDLAEMKSIASVFCGDSGRKHKLHVGSIKSNIGHLESSSGLAAFIKTILILERGSILPNADFQAKKHSLDLETWNIKIPTTLEPWPVVTESRLASVNSFGYGGTNAHVILESGPIDLPWNSKKPNGPEINGTIPTMKNRGLSGSEEQAAAGSLPDSDLEGSNSDVFPRLCVLSAKSRASLLERAAKLANWACESPERSKQIQALAYTLSSRRSLMQWRYSFVAGYVQDLNRSLDQKAVCATRVSDNVQVVFLFTGQGAQWPAMGRELICTNSVFATSLAKSDTILKALGAGWSLIDELKLDEPDSRIHEGGIAQPASTALQIALVDLLAKVGVKARMVLGHSSGEIAAAYACGVLSHELALRISYCRSFIPVLCRRTISTRGAMLSVGLSEGEVSPHLANLRNGLVSVACINSPDNTTVSGDEPAILELVERLDDLGVFNRRLKVDTAYHSHHMRVIAPQYLSSLGTLCSSSPREGMCFMSSVTADKKAQDFGASYWVDNLISKVRFCHALQEFCRSQITESKKLKIQRKYLMIEIGPHKVLGGSTRQTVSQGFDSFDHAYFSTLVRGRSAAQTFLETIGKLFEYGYPVDLEKANSLSPSLRPPRMIRDLPNYPWDHSTTYWHESRLSREHRFRRDPPHDLLGVRIPGSTPLEPSWRHIISTSILPWLTEHKIDGLVIFPGAGYLCMAIEALRQIYPEALPQQTTNYVLHDALFLRALVVPSAPMTAELVLSLRIEKSAEATWHDFRISALSQDGDWREHCSGRIMIELASESSDKSLGSTHQHKIDNESNKVACEDSRDLDSRELYRQLHSNRNSYGPLFATISDLTLTERRASGHVHVPDVQSIMPANYQRPHIIHPATLDAIMHSALALYAQQYGPGAIMPVSIQELVLSSHLANSPGEEFQVTASLSPNGLASANSDIAVFQGNQETYVPVVRISKIEIRGLGSNKSNDPDPLRARTMAFQMKYAPDIDFVSQGISHSPVELSIREYLKLLAFKKSHIAILVIGDGAGAGQLNLAILQGITDMEPVPIIQYDFTDPTRESFPEAQEDHYGGKAFMRFRALDLQEDPLAQGFVGSAYDLVISPNLGGTNGSFRGILANIRKLIKVGGTLILGASRSWGPDGHSIDDALLEMSLTGVKFYLDDMSGTSETAKLAVSQATEPSSRTRLGPIVVITAEGLEMLAASLKSELDGQGIESTFTDWDSYNPTNEATCVILDNGERPILSHMTSKQFKNAIILFTGPSRVFWIAAQHKAAAAIAPEKFLMSGFARTALAENQELKIVTLDVQEPIEDCQTMLLPWVVKILSTAFNDIEKGSMSHEVEYIYRNGQIHIPRLVENLKLNSWMQRMSDESIVQEELYLRKSYPVRLHIDKTISAKSLHFVYHDLQNVDLEPFAIEISVLAHSASPFEVNSRVSVTNSLMPTIHGLAGKVSAVGSQARTKFQVGDRVCAWTSGGALYPSLARIDIDKVAQLSPSTSLAIGAAISVALMTAYYALVELTHMKKGQTLLIHGAASDIGQAALAVAHRLRVKVLTTESTSVKREALVASQQVADDCIFATEDPSLTEKVLQFTGSHGVDVVFNTLGTKAIAKISACVATLGFFVQVRSQSNPSDGSAVWPSLTKTAFFIDFDITKLAHDRPEVLVNLLDRSLTMVESSSYLARQEITTMSMTDIDQTLRKLRRGDQDDQMVLIADRDTRVKTRILHADEKRKKSELDPLGVYLIAGGSGDLGQKICHLLVSRGAYTIVLLSRKILSDEKQQTLERSLQPTSTGLKIISIACDISKKSDVDAVLSRFDTLGLPPVKGIIQAATVLQDSVLEKMTLEDFKIVLQTKLHGTHHLSNAFDNPNLDFFVMLSSLTGLTGSRGQANYAAGNTYEDGLAYSRSSHSASKAHYISLDLGMIEDTSAYDDKQGEARVKNLLRQGLIPVKDEEMLSLVDYAISKDARNDSCYQIALGINGKSIHVAENPTPATKGTLFTHVRGSYGRELPEERAAAEASLKERISTATSHTEAAAIISRAVCLQLASLIALDQDKIDVEAPLIDFGLDSLTAIELKNWIHKEFEASIQASEILDESCVAALSSRIASRSKVLKMSGTKQGEAEAEDSPTTNGEHRSDIIRPTQKSHEVQEGSQNHILVSGDYRQMNGPVSCPPLPLPNLDDTLEFYLASACPFLSKDKLEDTTGAIEAFQARIGQDLQKRLQGRYEDPHVDGWQHDLQVHSVYLKRRRPIHPYGTFYGSHLVTDTPHTTTERATIISLAAWEFRRQLDAGTSEQDNLNGEPLCMDSLKWLFNSTREPRIGVDEVCNYPGHDYIAVLRRGHIFKVVLVDELGQVTSYSTLKCKFEAIVESSTERVPALASLSADERDSWAGLQESVKASSSENSEIIDMLNAAAFVVSLDEGSPSTPTERCNQFLLGNPSNRWSDKSLQFVICENGTSGYVCEHSMLDMASVKQLNDAITHVILEHKADDKQNGYVNGIAEIPVEYTFTANTSILENIDRVQRECETKYAPAEFLRFRLPTMDNAFFRTHKIPSKAGIQLTIQLACLLYFGEQHPSWETLTMMPFHRGRLDWMQVVSPAVVDFCKSAVDNLTPPAEGLRLLRAAVQSHASRMTKIARGHGFVAHLEALQEVLRPDERVPALFEDSTWNMMRVTATRKIKTDASQGLLAQEAGFFMPDPESVFVHYEIDDDGCTFFVQSTEGRTSPFCKALEQAAETTKRIVEG